MKRKLSVLIIALACLSVTLYSASEKDCEDLTGCKGNEWCAEATYTSNCSIGCPGAPNGELKCSLGSEF